MVAPLKLRQQKSSSSFQAEVIASEKLPVASVLVDTPVSHLEGIYDYLVPEHLHETAIFGTKVLIDFGKTTAEGLIIGRKSKSEQPGRLKSIISVLSPSGLVTQELLAHIEHVRNRFGGGLWNLIKSAVPARVLKEEKNRVTIAESGSLNEYVSPELQELIGRSDYGQLIHPNRIKWAINFPYSKDPVWFLLELIKVRSQVGQVLVLVPDEKDLRLLSTSLIEDFKDTLLEVGSHLSKNLRYRNFLIAKFMSPRVIISTRSGAFTPLSSGATVIVLSDLDKSHYELHAPGWNTRDVTLLRDPSTSLMFISPSHSLEISRLIEIGWLEKKNYRVKNGYKFSTNEKGNSYILLIKRALERGSVLISVAEKGYANLFLCSRCRNTASCDCGGKLQIDGQKKIPKCYLCLKNYPNWKCMFCSDNRPFVISKGVDRTAEEIGKAIPRVPILISSGNKQIKELPRGKFIVIATAGSEPSANYAAVVMLDGEKLFNRPSLRAEEIAKFNWFSLLSKAAVNAEIYLSLPNHHPVVQAMLRTDSSSASMYELNSRKLAKLPPYYRVAVVSGDKAEISKFAENLRSDKNDYEITGPVGTDNFQSKILIRVDLQEAQVLVDLMDDITKVQGVKSKRIFNVRLDPFDL